MVDGKVIVELKVVKELAPIHEAQLMTYMKLTNCKVGFLINFNVIRHQRWYPASVTFRMNGHD
ncbi:MAG: GxxExxY protein [Lentimonas sp.]